MHNEQNIRQSQNQFTNSASAVSRFNIRLLFLLAVAVVVNPFTMVQAADDLSLRPGLSFNQDIDGGFPIVGKDLDDTKIDTGKPAFIFFGASGDLNTNRQAKRVVDLYHKMAANTAKFIIIDVDHPVNDGAKSLIKSYYKGYIPTELLIDKAGKVAWTQTGETDLSALKSQME